MVKAIAVGNVTFHKALTIFIVSLLLVGIVATTVLRTHRSDHAKGLPALLKTPADKYSVLSSQVKANEVPWILDSRRLADGHVLTIWDADTEANRIACGKEWSESTSYHAFCVDLPDEKVLAVELIGLNAALITYVPVSRIAKVSVGEKVRIKMGEIWGNGVVRALPRFERVVSETEPQTALMR